MIMVVDIGPSILCMTKGRFLRRPRIECPGHELSVAKGKSSRSTFDIGGAVRRPLEGGVGRHEPLN